MVSHWLRRCSLLGVLASAACGQAEEPDRVAATGGNLGHAHAHGLGPAVRDAARTDLLFLGSGGGVTVFDPAADEITLDARPAVPSQQGNTVFRTVPRKGGTEVTALDPRTGDVRWSQQLAEPLELRVASPDGSVAVLGDVRPPEIAIPAWSQTALTVVGGPERRHDFLLDGNYEPEAFSPDGSKLFLIEYLPPHAPDRYTLRLLDVATGNLEEVYDAHGGAREPMQGTARTHVHSPDGTRLYTYYEIVGEPYVEEGKPPFFAFVHVLDLAEGWAHCVDLAPPFGTGEPVTPGMAVSPDGSRLYVVDQSLGQLAEIDTEMLRVNRTAEVAAPASGATAAATVMDSGALAVALDDEVLQVDLERLEVGTSFRATGPVTALRSGPDGRLFVALPERVDVYDSRTGRMLDEVVADTGPMIYVDPGGVPIDATRDVIKCAC